MVALKGQIGGREALYGWRRRLLRADQHSLGWQSLGQPYRYLINASICNWMGPDRMADWWWLWAGLPPPLPESFHDDLICWDPPFNVQSQVRELPMPPTFMEWHRNRKYKDPVKLSVIRSKRAIAFVVEPSALTILNLTLRKYNWVTTT